MSDSAARAANQDNASHDTQTAWGADVEYSRGYYLVRGEVIVSDWRLPRSCTPLLILPLRATSVSVEGRYKILPGLYAAARIDHLGFSDVVGARQTDHGTRR